ncbi:hypothetical protein Are01nite_75920 [Actinoplanes regularis]|nr:hypothetical protein Are01nite_75920 [Actinoplanes regularis]
MATQTVSQAQKTTPNATAMTAAITMSIVRHLLFISMPPSGYREETHAIGEHDAAGEDRTSCAGITQIRYEGLRTNRTLSAVRSPVGLHVLR